MITRKIWHQMPSVQTQRRGWTRLEPLASALTPPPVDVQGAPPSCVQGSFHKRSKCNHLAPIGAVESQALQPGHLEGVPVWSSPRGRGTKDHAQLPLGCSESRLCRRSWRSLRWTVTLGTIGDAGNPATSAREREGARGRQPLIAPAPIPLQIFPLP